LAHKDQSAYLPHQSKVPTKKQVRWVLVVVASYSRRSKLVQERTFQQGEATLTRMTASLDQVPKSASALEAETFLDRVQYREQDKTFD
jgi:hypothetical protein